VRPSPTARATVEDLEVVGLDVAPNGSGMRRSFDANSSFESPATSSASAVQARSVTVAMRIGASRRGSCDRRT